MCGGVRCAPCFFERQAVCQLGIAQLEKSIGLRFDPIIPPGLSGELKSASFTLKLKRNEHAELSELVG